MSNHPLVSVIITTYNSEKFIPQTLQSVLNQTYNNLEIIVVDDQSSDRTQELVRSFILDDDRIKLITVNHAGRPSVTRNTGVDNSTGSFIAFLDGDDIWTADKIERQIKYLLNDPECALVYSMSITFGDVNFFSPHFEVLPLLANAAKTKFDLIKKGNSITCSSVLCRRDAFYNAGKFDEDPELKVEDYDLWIRIGDFGTYGFIPRVHVYYRIHSAQFSSGWETKIKRILYLAKKRNLDLAGYNFYRNRGLFFLLIRNSIQLLHYLAAGLGSLWDKIKDALIKGI
jgi:glycosyltransferase involved in cell wall biosynthesis